MWNYNIKSGSIWTVKSINELNETDTIYDGMTYGSSFVLILSAFNDIDNMKKFTYLKVYKCKRKNRTMMQLTINNTIYYIELDELKTGDQRSLDKYIDKLDIIQIQNVVKAAKDYFNLHSKKKPNTKQMSDSTDEPQQRIHKFGIDVLVTENENVKLDKNNKIKLSKYAKQDIIYNSKTDEDIKNLCYKYKIFPIKAMKEIKNRLVYQHKQKDR